MKMDTKDPTFVVTSIAVGVSILQQLYPEDFKDFEPDQLEGNPELIKRVLEFGISSKLNPNEITAQVLSAQVQLLIEERHQLEMLNGLAAILWKVLGNPQEGSKPPGIYYKAAQSMILSFLYFLCPGALDEAND